MKRALLLPLLALVAAWDPQTKKNSDVEAGNAAFAAGNWDEAVRAYESAARDLPDDPGVHFDLGAALLQRGQAMPAGKEREDQLDAASRELRLAGDAPDAKLKAGAHYNLGNLDYQRTKYQDALDEYKKALRLDPRSEDARHNFEMALAQLQKQQQQQQQQSGGKDNKQQKDPKDQKDQKDQQQQGQDQKDQQQKDQQQQAQQQQGQDQQDQQQQQQGQSQDQKDQQQKDQQGQSQDQKDQQRKDQQQKDQQAQQQKDQKDQQGQQEKTASGQPRQDQKAQDTDRKLDALEHLSKDRTVARERAHANTRRRDRSAKDW